MASLKEGARVQVAKLLVWHREGVKPNSVMEDTISWGRKRREKDTERNVSGNEWSKEEVEDRARDETCSDIDNILVYIIKFFIVNYGNVRQLRFLAFVCFR